MNTTTTRTARENLRRFVDCVASDLHTALEATLNDGVITGLVHVDDPRINIAGDTVTMRGSYLGHAFEINMFPGTFSAACMVKESDGWREDDDVPATVANFVDFIAKR